MTPHPDLPFTTTPGLPRRPRRSRRPRRGLSRTAHGIHATFTALTLGCWAPIWLTHTRHANRSTTRHP